MSEPISADMAGTQQMLWTFDMRNRFSVAEQIVLAFFAYMTAVALVFHLAARDLA